MDDIEQIKRGIRMEWEHDNAHRMEASKRARERRPDDGSPEPIRPARDQGQKD